MPDLLIELRSEEIPARMQARAGDDLRRLMTDGLVEAGLTYAHAAAFVTPRRLTLALEGLAGESPTRREERRGPREGAPETALHGFARGAGVDPADLELRETKKGRVWFATITHPGRPADDIVAEVLEGVIRAFPWPKSMRWGTGDLRWVRPLHSILCVLSDEAGARTVSFAVDGITAGESTRGHPFMAPGPIAVSGFEDYGAKLRRAKVLLDPEERRDAIEHAAHNQAFAQGMEVVADRGLLAELTGMVEWPVVMTGRIGDEFLDLPPEVLQTSMREHQKFLSLRNPATGRIEGFVTVADIEADDDGAAILAGNGRVLSARLSDARFFWENDLRTIRERGMEGLAEGLAQVTFHARLGTMAERVERIEALAREIAPSVGAKPDLAAEAARIAKADLQSQMVGEFPELQGVMGRYYAAAAGHDDGVPEACEEHYKPMGPGGEVPSAPVSVAVALADKIDVLADFFYIAEYPSGSKDPFALRRAALGAIRIILSGSFRISIRQIVSSVAGGLYHAGVEFGLPLFEGLTETDRRERAIVQTVIPLLMFFHDRLKVHLRDDGIRHDVIDACLAMPGNDDLTLLVRRARALQQVIGTDEGENLVQGFRRAHNILRQAEEADGVEYSFGPDPKLAETEEERALFAALDAAQARIAPALEAEDFAAAMAAMAALRGPVDAFFEAVQVNTDNTIIRRNRLNLLHRIRETCLGVADLTRLEG